MLITRLEILTLNLVAQKEFYSSVLDLPVHFENNSLHIQAGKTDLIFKAQNNFEGAYHFCFDIPQNQFANAKRWLSTKIPLLQDDKGSDEFTSDSWNSSSIYFKDSAGNILELIARHNQNNAVDSEFNSTQILQVSEIGLPSKDVISFAKELCEKLGVEVYKQDFNETFTPIGDEDGLLILPSEGRIWYPNTGVSAQLLPIKIVLETSTRSFQIHGFPYETNEI